MASGQELLKYFGIFFTILFIASSVMAVQEMPPNTLMGKKLLSLTDIVTCGKKCNSDSDCSDGWICKSCKYTQMHPTDPYAEWVLACVI
ncbi:fruit-specific protein-like [Lycium barbarum]|uniref:fruit-specific protein-like n=1 Tax=Lycium barbarum TaxID=112863 RepID=UPI00293F68F1|nr:fruit-specific protein-like [Lycium barbarum]